MQLSLTIQGHQRGFGGRKRMNIARLDDAEEDEEPEGDYEICELRVDGSEQQVTDWDNLV